MDEDADGVVSALVDGAPVALLPEEYTQRLVAAEPQSTAALPGNTGLVVLNSTVTAELEAEGWARDLIRDLQDARKSAGLAVSDRIVLVLDVDPGREEWARTHLDLVAGEVLATEISLGPVDQAGVAVGDGVRALLQKA